LGALRTALTDALAADDAITDESSAMERAGYTPVLVEGQASNLKITHADDLELAEYYLQRRGKP
jgi:2-C-methyl-D-erythritol 4-phosphate cytidylyltransferase